MKRMISMLMLAIMLSTFSVGSAFAEYVYVTKNGKKYHHAESRFVKDKENVEKITKEEAEERGLEPSKSYLRYKAYQEAEDEEK